MVTTSIATICVTDSNTIEKEMTHSNVLKSSIQDGAATKLAEELGLPRVTCAMHQLDKVPRYATGTKVRTKGGVPQCEFPECTAVIEKARKVARYFAHGEARVKQLHSLCDFYGAPEVKPALDLSDTRIAALHNLILTVVRLEKPLLSFYVHCAREDPETNVPRKKTLLKDKAHEQLFRSLDSEFFRFLVEIEAVPHVVKMGTTIVQAEKYVVVSVIDAQTV